MSSSILEYLSSPNPLVDSTESLDGLPAIFSFLIPVTGMRPWVEFNYETLIALYDDVLQQTLPRFPAVEPPLTSLEMRIFDEDSLEHLLSRAIVPSVNYALEHAWRTLHEDPCPKISRGGRAKNMNLEDKRFYPDWAGVHDSFRTEHGFKNICPGDTKLSTKWTLADAIAENEHCYYPLQQIQSYCGESWNVRYGYLITQEELVVFRISKAEVGSSTASTRSKRDHQVWDPVFNSLISMPMSIEEATGYGEGLSDSSAWHYGNVEYHPIEFKSIPWDESGEGKLTVKLALWWLHMMAAAPGCDTSVKTEYPPLNSWSTSSDGKCRHSSTGVLANKPPLDQPTEPSTSASQRRPVAASQSTQSGSQQPPPS